MSHHQTPTKTITAKALRLQKNAKKHQCAVFFDLDGTLTDPKAGITRCIQHAMIALGRTPLEADDLHWCIGPPLQGSFSRLLNSSNNKLLNKALFHYRDRFSTIGLFENRIYPQVPEVLRSLRASGYGTFVVTSKPHVFATRIIEHFALAELFDNVYGSELDGQRTDKGELIAHALSSERLQPSRVVMVGDREHDVIGARRCNVRCIGVTYGYGTELELRANGAAAIATSPGEILGLVEMLLEPQGALRAPLVSDDSEK